MNLSLRLSLLTVGAVLAFAGVSSAAGPTTTTFPLPTYNPNYYIAPGLTINQYAYNLAVIGRAMQQVPPYAMGYNPYPPTFYVRPRTMPIYPYPYISTYPGYGGTLYPYYGTYPGLP